MATLNSIPTLLVCTLAVAGVPHRAAALGFEELALSRSSDAVLHVFAIDDDGSITHAWPSEPTGPWTGAERVGGHSLDVAALARADGRFEVLAIDRNGVIQRSAQASDSYDFGSWEKLGGDAKRLSTASSGERAGVFFVGADDALWFGWRDGADGAWSEWRSTGLAARQVAAAAADGGRFTLAVVNPDDSVSWAELDPAAPEEIAWQNLGGRASDLAAARLPDGGLVLAASGSDGAVSWNERRDAGWTGWQALGGAAQRIDLAELDGELLLTALDASAVTRARRANDGSWSEWQAAPELSPLDSTFRGTARVDIPEQDISEDRNIELGIRFSVDRTRVEISDF
ncbi:MAG TPA: hypothetical protein VJR89_03270, partial [Polyangiales bacterium]|nr:hypothetical protein [Polyangiales bacterium]